MAFISSVTKWSVRNSSPTPGTRNSKLEALILPTLGLAIFAWSALFARQGYKIACLEEIAFNKGWITEEQVFKKGKGLANTDYGSYLLQLCGLENDKI